MLKNGVWRSNEMRLRRHVVKVKVKRCAGREMMSLSPVVSE